MLTAILDTFKERYKQTIVIPNPIDITSCFQTAVGDYDAPNSYGNLEQNKVLLYVVKNTACLTKYKKNPDGRLVRENGKTTIKEFDDDIITISCLCIHDLRNTSYHEIRDALQSTNSIQGYTKKHMHNIEETIKKELPCFNPENDNAFIFSDTEDKVHKKIALNALWFQQLATMGHDMLTKMSYEEARLMEDIFPESVLKGDTEEIRRHSYMYGRAIHTRESEEFLEKKIQAYQAYMRTHNPPLFPGYKWRE